jgi:hypothetical protein
MQETVIIGKSTYKVTTGETTDVPYILTDKKGYPFYLCRNKNRPYLMFPIPHDGTRRLPKWWVSDKDGELKQVEVR